MRHPLCSTLLIAFGAQKCHNRKKGKSAHRLHGPPWLPLCNPWSIAQV